MKGSALIGIAVAALTFAAGISPLHALGWGLGVGAGLAGLFRGLENLSEYT